MVLKRLLIHNVLAKMEPVYVYYSSFDRMILDLWMWRKWRFLGISFSARVCQCAAISGQWFRNKQNKHSRVTEWAGALPSKTFNDLRLFTDQPSFYKPWHSKNISPVTPSYRRFAPPEIFKLRWHYSGGRRFIRHHPKHVKLLYGLKGALCETDFRPKFRNLRSEEERNEDLHSSVTKDLKASRIQRQKASNAWKADRNCVGASAEVFSLLKKVKKYKSSNISACKRPTGNLNPFLESLFRAHRYIQAESWLVLVSTLCSKKCDF